MAKDIDVDFILKNVDENLKTSQASYEFDVERISQVAHYPITIKILVDELDQGRRRQYS
jgi:hypothetical protein